MKNIVYSVSSFNYADITYNLYANSGFYVNFPFIVDVTLLAGLFFSPFICLQQKSPTKKTRVLYWVQVALFVTVALAIFTLLYLQFTPVATPSRIDGVQPRYFLPFIPLLLMIPHTAILSRGWRMFAATAPFIGVSFYLVLIAMQLFL